MTPNPVETEPLIGFPDASLTNKYFPAAPGGSWGFPRLDIADAGFLPHGYTFYIYSGQTVAEPANRQVKQEELLGY